MKDKCEVDSYEGNEATYLGMKIPKVNDGDFEGVVLVQGKYVNKLNQIEIPHGRMLTPNGPLAEAEQAILRSWRGD